ncbi:MAG: methyltransferase domain-containing protein [Pseudomonadales bacterium]|nr:methyltransferase domain-containing protein [Pseudomonadales bacterium]
MNLDSFYQDHWRDIEDDRLKRYDTMFQWRPEQDALLAPLDLKEGLTVVDYGCGPGYLAMEIARRVGEKGKVFGLDLNASFINAAIDKAKADNLAQIDFVLVKDNNLPVEANSVDRILCKNVLEYVPDALETLKAHHEILAPGGLIQILDSDWGFVIVEPWGKKRVDEFFDAASAAFKEPYIGRKLSGLLNQAGFKEIDIKISPWIDKKGHAMSVLTNMVSYIDTFQTLDKIIVDSMMAELNEDIASGDYLFVLPQFVVTAKK